MITSTTRCTILIKGSQGLNWLDEIAVLHSELDSVVAHNIHV